MQRDYKVCMNSFWDKIQDSFRKQQDLEVGKFSYSPIQFTESKYYNGEVPYL